MNPTLEHFSDAELLAGARNAQSHADTLPTALAGPLQSLAAHILTELACRRIAQRESSCAT